MRVLFVTPYPVSRIRIRSYGFVSQLAKQHDLTVLTLCADERDQADMRDLQRQGIAITCIREKRVRKSLRCLFALGTRLPLQVAYDAAPTLRAAINEQLASGQFDVLHVEFIRALGALPDWLPLPVVWDAVDCISQLYEQGARFGTTPMLRFIGHREARRTRVFELEQLKFKNARAARLSMPNETQHRRRAETRTLLVELADTIDSIPDHRQGKPVGQCP